jgi:hypothetical protein
MEKFTRTEIECMSINDIAILMDINHQSTKKEENAERI